MAGKLIRPGTLGTAEVVATGPMRGLAMADVKEIQGASVQAVLEGLGSRTEGLDQAEAAGRLDRFGYNRLPAPAAEPIWREFLRQLGNMFAVMLAVGAALAFAIWWVSVPRDPGNFDLGVGILAVVVINAAIGFAQEHAAERTAAALQGLVPVRARVVRAGQLREIAAEEVVPGDVVSLEAGDYVPADCRVVGASALQVEMSALTGESAPLPRSVSPCDRPSPLDAEDLLFMGTSIVAGSAKAVVYATGLATEFGRIFSLAARVEPEASPLQRQVDKMARRVAVVAIAAGILLYVFRTATGHDAALSFVFALGVMVALVPEGMPATLSVSLALAVRRMARKMALIKRLPAVQSLGSTTVICTDKTGTLTTAEMTVVGVFTGGKTYAVSGAGFGRAGSVEGGVAPAGVLRAASLASTARLSSSGSPERWSVVGDPTEGAILIAAAKAGLAMEAIEAEAPQVATFPFDPSSMLMSVVRAERGGFVSYVKGSSEAVLSICNSVVRTDGADVPLDQDGRELYLAATRELASQALRVLAVAERLLPNPPDRAEAESSMTLLGLVAMADPPRDDAEVSVRACQGAGIRVLMVTGDHALTALAVARQVGIAQGDDERVVTGDELDTLSDEELRNLLTAAGPPVFARVRPQHKLRIVTELEAMGEVVAVTGDGANDAPALKRASVGVAMGRGGTDVARAAAEMVLLDDSFSSIASAVEQGRAVYENIRRFVVYVFTSNVAELVPIVVGALVGFPLVPITALQVLAVDLGLDVLPALALGWEPAEPGTMSRPPRPPSESLLSWALVRRVAFLGGMESAAAVLVFFWRVQASGLPWTEIGPHTLAYRQAITLTQAAIVFGQLFVAMSVRSERESLLSLGAISNRPLVGGQLVAMAMIAAISYLPAAQRVFGTAALSAADWGVLAALGFALLLADEARKWLRRRLR